MPLEHTQHDLVEDGECIATMPNRFLGLHIAHIMWGDRCTRDYDGDFHADCASGVYRMTLCDHMGLIVWENGRIIR